MSDRIKREDAIKAIEDLPNAYNGWSDVYDKSYIIQTIEEVPAAENKGEWASLHNGKWKCSECGIEVLFYAKGNFCPNCGCRMKGAE